MKQFEVPEDIAVRVPAENMASTVTSIFEKLGLPREDAAQSTDVLIYADLRGIDSHGVSNMMPLYVEWLTTGRINATPQWKVIREAPATATVDSDSGLGLALGPQIMDLAIAKARECGVGTVAVRNGAHFGAAAYHAALALDHDMIGVAMTIGGMWVVPTFGAEAKLGLNPIAVAAPTRNEPAFIFDASMSSIAGNKIRIAERLGSEVLPGWIAMPDGTPVMDERPVPDDYWILPLGGTREIGSHKGYGLTAIVDILSGVLSGNGPQLANPDAVSHHFSAYRIDAFCDPEQFKDDMDTFVSGLAATAPAPGHDRVVYAGLVEHETEIERRANGIPYHPDVVEWFVNMTGELDADCSL